MAEAALACTGYCDMSCIRYTYSAECCLAISTLFSYNVRGCCCSVGAGSGMVKSTYLPMYH